MGILKIGSDNGYLLDYKHGRIPLGLSISCALDKFLRFKRGQYVGVLGGNNVGKTYFMAWYFLCLSVKHNLKWVLWMDENKKGRVMRDLVQWYTGRKLKDLSDEEIIRAAGEVEKWFSFVDNTKLYKPKDLLEIFKSMKPDGVLIDPFNQLDRPAGYSENLPFIREIKHWCKVNDTTLYLTMHPNTETQRKSSQFPEGHEWEGHSMMPLKHNAEGGSLFSNMADDWINLNRLSKLPSMKFFTMVDIDKIKDVDTGGGVSEADLPLLFHFNDGLGFTINGVNPLKETQNKFKEPTKESSLNDFANVNF